jgi:hypothetical protein
LPRPFVRSASSQEIQGKPSRFLGNSLRGLGPDLAEFGFGLDRAWSNFNMRNMESVRPNSRREPDSSRYKRHAKYAYEICL